jgi:hypothetical protein
VQGLLPCAKKKGLTGLSIKPELPTFILNPSAVEVRSGGALPAGRQGAGGSECPKLRNRRKRLRCETKSSFRLSHCFTLQGQSGPTHLLTLIFLVLFRSS